MAVYGAGVYGAGAYGSPAALAGPTAPYAVVGRGGGMTIASELWRMTKDNERVEDLSDVRMAVSVDWDESRSPGTAMAASVTVSDPRRLRPDVDWVAPFLRLTFDDGSPPVYRQIGLFLVQQPDERHTMATGEGTYEGRDVTWLLAQSAYADASGSTAGGDVKTMLEGIAAAAGITRTSFATNGRTLAKVRTFKMGSTRMEAVTRLARAINRYAPLADMDGTLTTFARWGQVKTHPWQTLTTADMVGDVTVHPEDPEKIANVVIVKKDNPNAPPLVAVRKNTDPLSAVSIPRLGYERLYGGGPVSDPNLETQADVDDLADDLLEQAKSYHRVVTLSILARNAEQVVPGIRRSVRLRNFVTAKGDLSGYYWVHTWRVGMDASSAALQLTLRQQTKELGTA